MIILCYLVIILLEISMTYKIELGDFERVWWENTYILKNLCVYNFNENISSYF